MNNKESFLKSIEEMKENFDFKFEQDDGKIAGFRIPMEWFTSNNISKEVFEKAVKEILEEEILDRERNGSSNTLESYKYKAKQKHPGKEESIEGFRIKRDEKDHAYMEVIGQDDFAKLIIYQDGKYPQDVSGFRVPESVLINKIKRIIDTKKVQEFIAQQGGNLNAENLDIKQIYDLMKNLENGNVENDMSIAGKNISNYAQYIREESINLAESIIRCDVAEESLGPRGPRKNKYPMQVRVNDVIDAEHRYKCLRELNPEYTISINPLGNKNGRQAYQFVGFVYDLHRKNKDESGKMLVIEPENGTSYTRTVFISQEKIEEVKQILENNKEEGEVITNQRVYEQIVAETLTKTRSQIAKDSRIQQTGHTTRESFESNCRYFVCNDRENLEGSILYTRIKQRKAMMLDTEKE